jgi:cytochrome c biogenesis protein CcmG/thiol:disulfide interchange protein DsbE
MKLKALIPLIVFVALAVLLGWSLRHDPRLIPSPLINKPAPEFALPVLHQPDTQMTLADMRGKVWLLNVWASWCVSCRDEHPVLLEFSKRQLVPIIGLDYKDKRDDALAWLNQFGNPYTNSIMDTAGRVGIDFGVYGVPETFLIDGQGRIRYKFTGPLNPDSLEHVLLPHIKELQGA